MIFKMIFAQGLLLQLIGTALSLTETDPIWRNSAVVQSGVSFDYIVVGAGTAGCIVATRLAEDGQARVLLIEAGGEPPLESKVTGDFTKLVRSTYDWNYTTVPDNYLAQNTVSKVFELTSGKMLGGTAGLNHVMHVKGDPNNYNSWAEITNDTAWNFENMLPYFMKSEKMVVQKILESENGKFYGRDGNIELTQDSEDVNKKYLKAFKEIGQKTVTDVNGINNFGYTETVLCISKDGVRQSTAESYLGRIKNKINIEVMKNTEVIKILFDNDKNAIGVVARNSTKDFEIYSTKEIIVTAGIFNSAKLLMLSGVGPKQHLESLNIDVISDLPVGKNLQDHPLVLILHKMGPSSSSEENRDPHRFPLPNFLGFAAVNKSQDVLDYQSINLVFKNDSASMRQVSSALFNFIDDIGETMADVSEGNEMLLSVIYKLYPKSRGKVELASSDPSDSPLIYLNLLSDDQDRADIIRYLQDFLEIQKSEYFNANAELIIPNIGCKDATTELEFWECYVNAVVTTTWHYVGTCSLGDVVDTSLKVIGVGNLRVADASVIPKIPSAKMNAPVMAIAEKAADLIKKSSA